MKIHQFGQSYPHESINEMGETLDINVLNFGQLVKYLRKKKSITSTEFALKLNVCKAYISRIELYDEIPSPRFICKMAEALEESPCELLERAGERKIKKYKKHINVVYKKSHCRYLLDRIKNKTATDREKIVVKNLYYGDKDLKDINESL